MKAAILAIFILSTLNSHSQDKHLLQKIDSIVSTINYSDAEVSRDSSTQDLPDLGLSTKTYLTMMVEGKYLKKYVNYVKADRVEEGVLIGMVTCNTFYFDQNALIKVEEFAMADNQVQQFSWYFQNDKCVYHSLQTDDAESRSESLIVIANNSAKAILKTN